MRLAEERDLIAREWPHEFDPSFKYASVIVDKNNNMKFNDVVVHTYLEMLAEIPDTFIAIKHGEDTTRMVSENAAALLENYDRKTVAEFDEKLIKGKINPGSTADLMSASIFLALARGMRL